MRSWTFDELYAENATISLGLQYAIAQRERLEAVMRIVGTMLRPDNSEAMARIIKAALETPAERLQDIFALLANGGKEDGFFVEFGACNGLAASNTLTLEREFGWTGILGEPSTFWHDRLKGQRAAAIEKRCVSSSTGDHLTFYELEMPGNSSPLKDPPYLGDVKESYSFETVSLNVLLRYLPRIDFLSIDTEGYEFEILSTFDFNAYRFCFICVEQHDHAEGDIRPLLKQAG